MRIRTDAKTGHIQSIEVIWADFSLSRPPIEIGNLAEMKNRERRAEMKHRQEQRDHNLETRENFEKGVANAIAYIDATLEASCGKAKQNRIGRHRDMTVSVRDYTNPMGTTLRLFDNDTGLVMTLIHRTDELENQNRRLLNETIKASDRNKAAAENVTTLTNGDVVIKNIPMHNQGPTGACVWASGAMILEYWGSPTSIELLTQRLREFNATTRAGAPLYGAAEDTRLNVKTIPVRMNAIMSEIDAGRPIQVRRYLHGPRTELHIQWRDAAAADPDFEIPTESRKEQKENWANDTHSGHASIITGYNKEKDVILLTESWGEHHRNSRMSFDEFKAGCRRLEAFSPK